MNLLVHEFCACLLNKPKLMGSRALYTHCPCLIELQRLPFDLYIYIIFSLPMHCVRFMCQRLLGIHTVNVSCNTL